MTAYHTTEYSIHEIDDATWASWVSTDHPKAHRYAPVPQQPSYDAATHTCEWGAGEWVVSPIPAPTRRVWASGGHLWGEFTDLERVSVAASEVPQIKALVLALAFWPDQVFSDDPRVQSGFAALVTTGLLSPQRANEILHPPGFITTP